MKFYKIPIGYKIVGIFCSSTKFGSATYPNEYIIVDLIE